jgi:hypothetical protein
LVKAVREYRIITLLAVSLVTFLVLPVAAQDDVSIKLSLDRNAIGLNETAILSVTMSGAGRQQLPDPKLPPLPQFEIYSAGSSTNLQIINGAMTYGQTYNYILSPKKEGTFPIRSAWVVVDGKRYESNELSIKVLASGAEAAGSAGKEAVDGEGKAKDLFLTAEVDKKNPYVDEQVTLNVKFYRAVKILSTPDYIPPQTPEFWTNEIGPQKQYYQTIEGRDYLVIEIKTALFPTKPGKLTIDRAQVTATVADRRRRRSRDPFSLFDDIFQQGRNVTVKSKPITVNVRPLPTKGKTELFSGGVGSYKISAAVDKREVEVNEAITLTVKISGRGNIKSIPEPSLPELADFRVEESSSDFKIANLDGELGGSKTFEYVLIPRLPGLHTVDPITLNYFDPGRKKYITAKTNSITLSVKQGELATGPEIPYNMVSGQTINLRETDIRFIRTGDGNLVRRGRLILTSPVFLAVTALPLVALLGGIVDVRRRRRLTGDVAYARLRRANAIAKKRLKKAEKLMSNDDKAAFYAEISGVILQYIADKFNCSAHGLTSDGVEELLRQKSIDDDLWRETLALLQQADFGRFAGAAESGEARRNLFERVRKVFVGLEDAI